jgi:hypothetical protein
MLLPCEEVGTPTYLKNDTQRSFRNETMEQNCITLPRLFQGYRLSNFQLQMTILSVGVIKEMSYSNGLRNLFPGYPLSVPRALDLVLHLFHC